MILLIDAYNVLKQNIASDEATQQEKASFIEAVKRYAHLKNIPIELVFDGGPYGLPDSVTVKNVRISHSGSQESADDVIKSLIRGYKGREVLLVSTDRELGRYALLHGVDAIDSADFYHLMQKTLVAEKISHKKGDKGLVKTSENKNAVLDALMAESTLVIKKGPEEGIEEKTEKKFFGQKKSSKMERRLEKKVRKL
jgi:predicted RNA-binding protein with PIN domain